MTNILRTAAQAALSVLDEIGQADIYPEQWQKVEALRAALAQPEQQGTGKTSHDSFDNWISDYAIQRAGQFCSFSVDMRAAFQAGAAVGEAAERERNAGWFALVMNAAAALEDAANCLRDQDAKRAAEGAAKHFRAAANAMWEECEA